MTLELPPYLREAADRVAHALQGPEADLPRTGELVRQVADVAGLVHAALLQGDAVPPPSPSTLRASLLDLLRGEVLSGWREGGGAPPLLDVMRTMEEVRRTLSGQADGGFGSPVLDPWSRGLLREVAHLLRSPLASMMFLTEILASGQSGELNELQRDQLRILQRATLTVGTMAGDLLWLSGPAEELAEGEGERFSVADLMDEVSSAVRPIAEVKGLALEVHAPSGHRSGRPLLLKRILLDLLLAIAGWTDRGRVLLRAEEQDGDVLFTLLGDGRPPAANLEEIACLFPSTPEEEARSMSGSGLAISSARRRLAALGSQLELASSDRGSGFTFRLPLPIAR